MTKCAHAASDIVEYDVNSCELLSPVPDQVNKAHHKPGPPNTANGIEEAKDPIRAQNNLRNTSAFRKKERMVATFFMESTSGILYRNKRA